MRVLRDGEDAPPTWPLKLLEKLGAYVFSSGRSFALGYRLAPGGSITGQADTRLTAVAFTSDPELGAIATPHGRLDFLQAVEITADELDSMKAASHISGRRGDTSAHAATRSP